MIRYAAALAAGMTLAAPALAETWNMPVPYGDTTFHTVNIREFASDVATATDGALEIEVHSAGSLFPHAEIKNAVRSRQVPIGEFLLSRLSNEDAAFGIDSQPFLATSYEEAMTLWEAQKPVITELMAEQDLMPLFSVPWPAQGLYTNGEIATVDDLSGLRFRAYNAALEQLATLAKAAPVQVEAPDIAQAFSTGQVEAMMTSPSTGANSSAWDYVNTYTAVDGWLPKNIVVVNKRMFDALPEDVQAAVMEAAAAAETRGWDMSAAEADEKKAVMAEHDMAIVTPTPELMEGLKGFGATMMEDWSASASDEGKAILDSYSAD
ncbi:TRAP transporter substrate-binding protein [Pseudooceanicola algae]|uniref:Uncharacterized protein n=1 Tax=Pseudooceanicola algae TaxID=1537215 RepID=A0A418SH91_9RHOB|nr:TRAP transporter substrate-binding protein [Pseudooceanicola algae]QPM90417.1 hypothetical protein PSAL_016550 [Pseudooceanicola algae]